MYRRRRYDASVGGLGGLFVGFIFGAVWLAQNVLGIQLPFGEAVKFNVGSATRAICVPCADPNVYQKRNRQAMHLSLIRGGSRARLISSGV